MISIIFSISSNLFADMIRDHDYLQYQWSWIMISSVSGIPDHGGNPWSCLSSVSLLSSMDYDIISSINNHWSWLSLVSVVISWADMIRDHDYLQCQWSLIMISSVSGIPDHGGNPWSCLSSVSLLSSVDMILSPVSIITYHDYL